MARRDNEFIGARLALVRGRMLAMHCFNPTTGDSAGLKFRYFQF